MEKDLQEEEFAPPVETCDGEPKPKSPPEPGDRGAYICGPNGWQWVPAG